LAKDRGLHGKPIPELRDLLDKRLKMNNHRLKPEG
jgi:hypothetical protein